MKSEGEQLRQFIDNQPKSKISIAKELGMSKQNLFGLFKSRLLEDETKSRFEQYFGQSIFSQDRSSMMEENEVQYATINRTSLERSIENLTENELRTTAVIERLVSILEFNLMGGNKDHHVFADPGLNQGGEGFAKPSGKSKKS